MGYRTYIGSMPKKEYNKIKSLTSGELFNFYKTSKQLENENDYYIGVYEFGVQLHEFGKYTDFDPPKKSLKYFFKNKELKQKYTEETDLFVVTKEFLEYIIEYYKSKIKAYYNDMILPFLKDDEHGGKFLKSVKTNYGHPNDEYEFDFSTISKEEQTALYKTIEHVRSFRVEWTFLTPFDLSKGKEITTSWKYEYAIFELIRIYKSFDWKRSVMIYYGY